jgi:sulfofructosephosphate aldolase
MTPSPAAVPAAPVAALARPSGTFAMVAMDQRDSLRTMMAQRAGTPGAAVTDAAVTGFKLDVVRALGPHASALLIDRHYGYRDVVTDRLLPKSCALILAADALDQQPGGPVTDTALDDGVDPAAAAADGARALKLLLVWRRDELRDQRVAMAAEFVARCRAHNLASVLEPVARPTPAEEAAGTFRLNDAIVEAAGELAPLRPSLYKCQVPDGGAGTVAELVAQARRIDDVVDVPWVVLSQGVDPARFPHAVEAACRAGASGFLAGRTLWTSALDAADTTAALRGASTDRLRRLGEIVDTHGRPWWDAPAHREGGAA